MQSVGVGQLVRKHATEQQNYIIAIVTKPLNCTRLAAVELFLKSSEWKATKPQRYECQTILIMFLSC